MPEIMINFPNPWELFRYNLYFQRTIILDHGNITKTKGSNWNKKKISPLFSSPTYIYI